MPNPQFCLLHLPPPLLKIPRPRGDDHKMHEIAVAVDAVAASAVDAAAAADRPVSSNGGSTGLVGKRAAGH